MKRKSLTKIVGGLILVIGVTAYVTYVEETRRLEPILEEQRRVIAENQHNMQAELDAVSQREDLSFEEKMELIKSIHKTYSDKNIENLQRTVKQIVEDGDSAL